MINVNIKPSDNNIFVLLDLDEDIYIVIDVFDTSYFSNKIKIFNPNLVYLDVDKILDNPLYMKLVRHACSSQRPSPSPSSSFSGFDIVDALKIIKSKRRSRSDLIIIDFDNIDVYDIKYLL